MKVIGIICEYNPFHNGHLYHINKIKELYPNSLIVLVLNGYFLQRGEISIINKYDKTAIALKNNIDIVVELPFVFGTQSADVFAHASITLLEQMHCEYVVFGSECNNIDTLNLITDYMINDKDKYDKEVKNLLNKGLNYPTALAKAINIPFSFKSNDLLAISYIKAIKLNNYKIKPITIQRTNDYLDIIEDSNIISASNIRNKLANNLPITKYVPENTLNYIKSVSLNNAFNLLKYKILTDKDLSIYLDVDEGIEYRLKKVINKCTSVTDLIEKTKSKRYTYNKIQRMLIHILIGLTKNDNKALKIDYIKILGYNENGKKYLNKIKKDINLPTRPCKQSLIYQYELKACSIYDMLVNENNLLDELKNKPIDNLTNL